MFTEDVFAFYGGKERFGPAAQVHTGRIFVLGLTAVAYLIALRAPATIFELAVQYAFSGFASLFPLLAAALFWKGSTKWGALASTLWTVFAVVAVAVFQYAVPAPQSGPPATVWTLFGMRCLEPHAGRDRSIRTDASSSDGPDLAVADDRGFAPDPKTGSANFDPLFSTGRGE